MFDDSRFVFLFGLTTGISIASAMYFLSNPKKSHLIEGGPTSKPASRTLSKLERDLSLPVEKLHKIAKHMVNEMKKGLASDGQTLKMIPSFVTKRPTGTESGTYLALDLGGSNFRVCEVCLLGGGSMSAQQLVRVRQKKFVVSDDLKKGDGSLLFDFFATCTRDFVEELKNEDMKMNTSPVSPVPKERKMGFTFSFPVRQVAIDKGSLMQWTKGFSAAGVEGQDVVELLQAAFDRKGVRVKVAALVNDTVGTLMAHAYTDPQTIIGVILGTGTNAAYVEDINAIPKWNGPHVPTGEMIINMEWGAFDEEHAVLPVTQYDRSLDKNSQHPGKQTFEKMISGMYLGEIVRLILLELVFTGHVFSGKYPPSLELCQPYSFETAYMSRIERDHSIELSDTKLVLEDILRVKHTSVEDRRIVKRVCELVGTRAARLSAAGIAAIATKTNRLNGCVVAIDGSLFEHYPHFGNRMRDALRELLGIAAENISLAQARDGSGQGAAIIASLCN